MYVYIHMGISCFSVSFLGIVGYFLNYAQAFRGGYFLRYLLGFLGGGGIFLGISWVFLGGGGGPANIVKLSSGAQ